MHLFCFTRIASCICTFWRVPYFAKAWRLSFQFPVAESNGVTRSGRYQFAQVDITFLKQYGPCVISEWEIFP